MLVVSLLLGSAEAVAAASAAQAAPAAKPNCPASLPDRASAVVTARLCGGKVEIANQLSETERVWAEPNGSFTVEQAAGVARFQRDGRWTEVDLTLQRQADGSVAPKAHPGGLRLAGAKDAGTHDLATVGSSDKRITLAWNGALPEPVLEGRKATYRNIGLGVDLVVEANLGGFEQTLVVNGRAGLPFVQDIRMALKLSGPGAEPDSDGGLVFKTPAGEVLARTPAPQMWDGNRDPISGDPVNVKRVAMALGPKPKTPGAAQDLVLSPDTDWMWDPARRFPITVDPYVGQNTGFDTYVDDDYADDLSTWTKVALGTTNSGVTMRNAFVNFTAAGMQGAKFNWATLKLWGQQASSCESGTWQVWRVNGVANTGTRWGNQPGFVAHMGNSIAPASGGCTGQWMEADATSLFQYQADNNVGAFSIGLVPYWNNTNVYYKEFKSSESGTIPHVTLNYSWPPTVGTRSTTPATTCTTGSGRPAINTTTPTLKAVINDDESDSVSATFEWWNVGGAQIGSATVSGSKGATLQTVVPSGKFANGGNYSWRVKGNDGVWDSPWATPSCEFTVDTAAPAAPGISSTSHPSQTSWYTATTFTGTLSASDSSGIAGYAVIVDGSATTPAGTTVTQAGTAVSLTGQPEGVRYAHVAAQDKAGNWSATTHYKFQIDTTKPGVPASLTSSTHPVNTNWYSSRTATVSWSAPSDLSGITQYAVKADQSATTVPATSDGLQTGTTVTTTVAADGVWYLHVRAKDAAGNWSDSAAHYKFQVDTDAPAAPEVSSSSHPDQNAAYTSDSLSASWTAPPGGAAGYAVTLDGNPATVPAATVTTTGTTHTATIGEGVWYLHVRAQDSAGNWGATTHFRITRDITAPATPAISSADFPAAVWSDKLNQEGVITLSPNGSGDVTTFRYQLNTEPAVDAAVQPGQNLNVSIVPSTGGVQTLTVWALDAAGNISGSATYRFFIGANAGTLTGPVTGDITAAKTVLRAQGNASTSAVTFQWRRADTDAWKTIPATDVTYTSGGTAVTWPVATIGNGAYPELNWDTAKTINDFETGPDPLDGPLQVRADFSGDGFGPSPEQKITFDSNRATAASASMGPGTVNLITGNYTLAGSDVSAGGLGAGRAYNTRQASKPDSMFGPGWISSVLVAEGSSPYTKLERFDSLVQVTLPNATVLGFTATGDGTTFAPPAGSEGIAVTYQTAAGQYTVTDSAGNRVIFGRNAADPAGQYRPYTVTAAGSATSAAMSWEKVTVDGTEMTRPTQVVAAAPAGVSCTSTLSRGCRALTFTYAAGTTATTSVWGDYTGRVKEIAYTAWDPATSSMATVVLARYAYDDAGRLRAQWDPRLDWSDEALHHVQTEYGYNSDGILTTLRPAGQETWQFTYTTVPADSGKGRLHQITRSALAAGTATMTVVYRVPVSGAGAPYNLSPGETARWGQDKAPTDATAIFPPSQIPNGDQAAGTLPGSFERANVSYMDANARQTNTAQPGGGIDTVWYDNYGNTYRDLTASGRKRALDYSATDDLASERSNSQGESSWSEYTTDGKRLTYTATPYREIALADGRVVNARTHTTYTYDEGAPATGGPFDLVTTETTSAYFWDSATGTWLHDSRTAKTEYDWTLKQPTKSIVDPSGLALVTRTAYDAKGRAISQTTPGGGVSDNTPSTRVTVYYTTAANGTYPQCGDRPEFDGMVCLTKAGGQPVSGPELAATQTAYNMFGQPVTTTESTSAGTLRTTTITYDQAGRAWKTAISAPGLGTPLEVRRNVYDQASGQAVKTQTIDSSDAVTAEIVRGYDTVGRLISYKDADGNLSTTTYDLLSRPVTVNDGKATRTYTYDQGTERRGLPTSVSDSNLGTFAGTYDIDGNLANQTWPNGVNITTTFNQTGDATGLTYTQPGCATADCTLFTETIKADAHGQQRARTTSLSAQTYGYDQAGRLTSVKDTVNSQCTTRTSTFDSATNRTGQTTYNPDGTGACQTTTAAGSTTWSIDTADRITTSGYTYDTLGRTLTMPGQDSAIPAGGDIQLGYHANDMAHTIVQGARTATYSLDVINNRFRTMIDSKTGTAITKVNHYSGDNDSPSWIDEGNSTFTRMIFGLGGLVAQHTPNSGEIWMLTSLGGHIIAGMPETGYGLAYTSEATENGQPRNTADAGNRRYGWHGAEQRNADTPGGLTLMGARLYTPNTGRFLSTDPVYGGSANPYEYCAGDGVNCADTTGQMIPFWAFLFHSDKCRGSWRTNHYKKFYRTTELSGYDINIRCRFDDDAAFWITNVMGPAAGGALGAFIGVIVCAGTGPGAAVCAAAGSFMGGLLGGLSAYWYNKCKAESGFRVRAMFKARKNFTYGFWYSWAYPQGFDCNPPGWHA